MEWCAIAYTRAGRRAEFQVVVIEKDGSRRSVARSPAFRAPFFGGVRRRGKAQAAHELLVSRLTAAGWRPVDVGESWHELGFIRSSASEQPVDRASITAVWDDGSAAFVAEQLDAFGNPSRLAVSPAFPAPRRHGVPSAEAAESAHEELLERLRSEGWTVVGRADAEWFSVTLERPADERDRSRSAGARQAGPVREAAVPSEARWPEGARRAKRPGGRHPDIAALVKKRDVEGLVQAARLEDSERGLTDDGQRVREQAVLALGELGRDVGSDAIAEALHDPSDTVRAAAVKVLGSRGEVGRLAGALAVLPPATGSRELAFQAILEQSSPDVARDAARALLSAPGEAAPTDADVGFLDSLTRSDGRGDAVVGELLKGLSDHRGDVAERAEELLVALGPISTPTLIDELESGGSPERAVSALGRIGDSRATQPLIRALDRGSEAVRVEVVAALGALRDPAVVEPLLRATRDPSFDVRAEASHALDQMGAAGVIFGMSAMLRSMVIDAVESVAEVPRTTGSRPIVAEIPASTESSDSSDRWKSG